MQNSAVSADFDGCGTKNTLLHELGKEKPQKSKFFEWTVDSAAKPGPIHSTICIVSGTISTICIIFQALSALFALVSVHYLHYLHHLAQKEQFCFNKRLPWPPI